MAEPMNGAMIGGGRVEKTSKALVRERGIEVKDQFEQEMGDDIIEEEEEGAEGGKKEPPMPTQTHRQSPQNRAGEERRIQDVSHIISEFIAANLDDLRIHRFSVEINGQKKLKISFGKESGRLLTLYMDGTWKYES